MTKNDFIPLFTMLCEVYNRELTKTLLLAYYTVLEELSKDQFESAVKSIIANRKYSSLPLPADILEFIHGNPDDKAILALKDLEQAMQRQGAYNSVCFRDQAIMEAVKGLGGWITICRTSSEEWKFMKKEFLQLYKAISKNPSSKTGITHLVGWNEHQNRISGYDDEADNEDVKLIGFSEIRNDKVKVCQIEEVRNVLRIDAPKEQNKVMQMLAAGIKRV